MKNQVNEHGQRVTYKLMSEIPTVFKRTDVMRTVCWLAADQSLRGGAPIERLSSTRAKLMLWLLAGLFDTAHSSHTGSHPGTVALLVRLDCTVPG